MYVGLCSLDGPAGRNQIDEEEGVLVKERGYPEDVLLVGWKRCDNEVGS